MALVCLKYFYDDLEIKVGLPNYLNQLDLATWTTRLEGVHSEEPLPQTNKFNVNVVTANGKVINVEEKRRICSDVTRTFRLGGGGFKP